MEKSKNCPCEEPPKADAPAGGSCICRPRLVGGLGTVTPLEVVLEKAEALAGGGCIGPEAGPSKADGPNICPHTPLPSQGEGKHGAKPGGQAGPP